MAEDTGNKLVNSVALTLFARISMIVASIAIPAAGWMLQRGVSSVDEVSRKIDTMKEQALDTNGTVKLIQQTQTQQTQIIADHEVRVRSLEQFSRTLKNLN